MTAPAYTISQEDALHDDNSREAALFDNADELYEGLKEQLTSQKVAEMSHSQVETFVEEEGTEVLRQLYQAHIHLRCQQEVQAVSRQLETVLASITFAHG